MLDFFVALYYAVAGMFSLVYLHLMHLLAIVFGELSGKR